MNRFVPLLALTLLTGATQAAAPLTCFQAKAVADRQVTPAVRNQLVSAVGPRSETEMTPTSWVFVYFDPNARQSGRQITVTGGAVTRILDGYIEMGKFRLAAYKEEETLKPALLKIDSTQALQIVKTAGQLKNSEISSALFDLRLSTVDEAPVWKVTILADRDGKETNIGFGRVSAATGQICELKLNLDKIRK